MSDKVKIEVEYRVDGKEVDHSTFATKLFQEQTLFGTVVVENTCTPTILTCNLIRQNGVLTYEASE